MSKYFLNLQRVFHTGDDADISAAFTADFEKFMGSEKFMRVTSRCPCFVLLCSTLLQCAYALIYSNAWSQPGVLPANLFKLEPVHIPLATYRIEAECLLTGRKVDTAADGHPGLPAPGRCKYDGIDYIAIDG